MISLGVFTQWRLDVGHPQRGGGGWGLGRQRRRCCIILSSSDMCVAAWTKSVGRSETCWHRYRSDYERLTWLGCVRLLHVQPWVTANPHSSLPTFCSGNQFVRSLFLDALRTTIENQITYIAFWWRKWALNPQKSNQNCTTCMCQICVKHMSQICRNPCSHTVYILLAVCPGSGLLIKGSLAAEVDSHTFNFIVCRLILGYLATYKRRWMLNLTVYVVHILLFFRTV